MDNIKFTIGYERREDHLLVMELLDAALKPQDIVAGLESGKYMLMGNAIIGSPITCRGTGCPARQGLSRDGIAVAIRVEDSTLGISTEENFILESDHCDNCGMPLEQKSIDMPNLFGRCIECTAMLRPSP